LVLFVGTTNVPQLMDMAFLRRIGGTIERFGLLGRHSFPMVLRKRLGDLPLASENGACREDLVRRAVYEMTTWLFRHNGEEEGQVNLFFVGSSVPEVRCRRHFLTAGLVERAVHQAADQACVDEDNDHPNPGLTVENLKIFFDEQIRAIVDTLRVENVHNYLELPEGIRVQSVQPVPQPPVPPYRLLRAV
jgi:hypothetical protein